MGSYQLTWITENIAAGHAPMSPADLEEIRSQGIGAIVNLCGEYCDLHEIEETSGFEVCYLPIPDECAPDVAEMEKALAWLDDILSGGRKALVHCRFGIGRTGLYHGAPAENGHGFEGCRKSPEKVSDRPHPILPVETAA